MIFAAGLGTRLRPLTDKMPKALVKVGGIPVLQRALLKIADAGIKDIVINVHHFPQMIREFLRSNDNFGLNIEISDESDLLLDTGGGLLRALDLLGRNEAVLLHNADIVSDFDLEEMIDAYRENDYDALLLTSDRKSSRRLMFDHGGLMRGWKNMVTGQTLPAGINEADLDMRSFGGIHIIGPTAFQLLETYGRNHGAVFSITPFYVDVCSDCCIASFTPEVAFRWYDIGRPESLAAAQSIDS